MLVDQSTPNKVPQPAPQYIEKNRRSFLGVQSFLQVDIWTKCEPNLAVFAAAFGALRAHARQGSNSQNPYALAAS